MAKRKKPSDEQGQENADSTNDADNFGLPEIDYKPLDAPQDNPTQSTTEVVREETVVHSTQPVYGQQEASKEPEKRSTYTYMEEENKSKAPIIIGLVIALVVVLAGFLIYQYVYKPQQEKDRQEKLAREKKVRDDAEKLRLAQLQREEEENRRRDSIAAANAQPKEGTIETLSERTRRYYVVISSAVDDDLVMDYARKLSAKGVSTKIIPPFGKYKFSRLAISDYDTFASAQSNADAVKAEYGGTVWVLKF